MQLIPIILLIIYALSSLGNACYWVLHNSAIIDIPILMSLLRGAVSGVFSTIFNFFLMFSALTVSIIVLNQKKYSDRSIAIGMTAFFAVISASLGIRLLNSLFYNLGIWRLLGG